MSRLQANPLKFNFRKYAGQIQAVCGLEGGDVAAAGF